MLSRDEFIRISLEINLFFQRIMKEHLYLLEANLQPVAADYIMRARDLKEGFEELLAETVHYANGVISEDAISSEEFVTPYTLKAEEATMMLTGVFANTAITKAELQLVSNPDCNYSEWYDIVCYLNAKSLALLEEVIGFQEHLMALVSECSIFIPVYPEMLAHDTREAIYYSEFLKSLEGGSLPRKTLCDELDFWNNIMGQHAQFIDGMLDPTERSLKEIAEITAEKIEKLVEECLRTAENQILQRSKTSTEGIIEFKTAATVGLLNCKIKSIIPPLLADHVLREANHYLRLLKMID